MQNFNRPYSSISISEFWSRWHISLSTWFRDYLYIPLGGNRVKLSRWIFNILIVFIINGFWHGASWTFVVWGALHGIYQVVEIISTKYGLRLPEKINFFNKFFVFFLVTIAWVFFRSETFSQAFYIVMNWFENIPKQLSLILHNQHFERLHILYLEQSGSEFFIAIFLLLFVEWTHYLQGQKSIPELMNSFKKPVRWILYFFLLYSILFLGIFETTQFIYFQF